MVTIIDYGVGNLFSLTSSFAALGEEVNVTAVPSAVEAAERIILPGVGAFGDAAEKLKDSGLADCLEKAKNNGVPILGICLGMQLLFDKSFEYGEHSGLGFIPGEIQPIGNVIPKDLQIPHMGWNLLSFPGKQHPLFRYIKEGDYVYFVHSYYAVTKPENTIATTDYGAALTAAASEKNVMGCQFHPEKSGDVGMRILKAFCEMKRGMVC